MDVIDVPVRESAKRRIPPQATGGQLVSRRLMWLVVATTGVLVVAAASLAIGNRPIALPVVIDALLGYDPTVADHLVVRELRLPRTALGLVAGASFSVAGVLMQAITRNPLAEPGLLGVNAGAAFAVVLGSWILGTSDIGDWVWLALIGAVVSSMIVSTLGSVGRGRPSPVRVVLAGAAVSALMFSLTRAITLVDQATLEQYRFWVVGSLVGRDLSVASTILPFFAVGLAIAAGMAGPLNSLSLGEDAARSLGLRVGATRAMTGISVMLLAGAAVAAVGPIVFVGLVVPHMARTLLGPDQRWLVAGAALLGSGVLLASDVVGRVVVGPSELQAGIVMAGIGGPIFILIVRRLRGESL